MNESIETTVQRYLDGDMKPQEREQFKKRLQEDPSLKEMVEEYTHLMSDLQDLNLPRLPKDLWQRRIKPAIEAELPKEDTFWTRVRGFFSGFIPRPARPAVSIVGFAILMIALTIFLQQQFFATEPQPYAKAFERIEQLRGQVASELSILEQEADKQIRRMRPEIREMYQETLVQIDDAIAQAERIYALYSNDDDAIEGLMAAYDNKAEFLRQILAVDASLQ